ncbi:MAG: hypothetical protein NZ874_01900 [Fimbriimonadales bacterium]|nr:hypothetical protein [Fimbriimonadales bacterium]
MPIAHVSSRRRRADDCLDRIVQATCRTGIVPVQGAWAGRPSHAYKEVRS